MALKNAQRVMVKGLLVGQQESHQNMKDDKTTAGILQAHSIEDTQLEKTLLKYWIKKCRNTAKHALQKATDEVEGSVGSWDSDDRFNECKRQVLEILNKHLPDE